MLTDKRYLEWLCEIVSYDSHRPDGGVYYKLLDHLNHIPFVDYDCLDADRISDAYSLRQIFIESYMGFLGVSILGNASVLEVLVALAKRGETHIMANVFGLEDRTAYWFWGMMRSLGLLKYTNDKYDREEVSKIIDSFLHRQYASDGTGGIFVCHNLPKDGDMREIDIWKQMCLWFNEILDKEGYFK